MADDLLFRVNSPGLNLRSGPEIRSDNRLAELAFGHVVTKVSEAPDPQWWQVSTRLPGGSQLQGFVKKVRLDRVFGVPEADFAPSAGVTRAVHATKVRPAPLGEPGQPRRTAPDAEGRVAELREIIDWLNAPKSRRYQPTQTPRATFCNIYAYDYCRLAGAYLPRVWWTDASLGKLKNGKTIQATPGAVREMTANMLFDWLVRFGPQFGWTRVPDTDLTALQDAANQGEVCLICAQRRVLSRSGHIVAVVPETEPFEARRVDGRVVRPVESQAGATNHRYVVKNEAFWKSSEFRDFGFWRHA